MAGLSPSLPLQRDTIDGYRLTKTFQQMISQNLRHLILTSPGERIMIPEFGVGLRRVLFEMNNETTYDDIASAIHQQAEKYMPFIEIEQVLFTPSDHLAGDENTISIRIEYRIIPLGAQDVINITSSLKEANL